MGGHRRRGLGPEGMALVAAVRRELAVRADPEAAPQMQRYMKSAMPFHGLRAPAVAEVMKRVVAEHPLPDRAAWEATVRTLWDEATRREERYCAIALTGARPYRGYQDPDMLALYRHLVVTGAWWDLVDPVATGRVGPIRRRSPGEVDPVLRAWAVDDDMWLRRVAILSQVGRKVTVDQDLLVDVLAPNLGHPDFFVRKAIGWALRDLAWKEPDWVRSYVAAREAELSPLSRREALKNIGP